LQVPVIATRPHNAMYVSVLNDFRVGDVGLLLLNSTSFSERVGPLMATNKYLIYNFYQAYLQVTYEEMHCTVCRNGKHFLPNWSKHRYPY
jgi:hypothetical protein